MTTAVDTVPCLVITDSEEVIRTNIDVRAEHHTPEPDVGFDGGYEVMRAVLNVDAKARAHIKRRCWIKVEGGTPVEVKMEGDAPAEGPLLLSADELDDEIADWLSAQAVTFDAHGDAGVAP